MNPSACLYLAVKRQYRHTFYQTNAVPSFFKIAARWSHVGFLQIRILKGLSQIGTVHILFDAITSVMRLGRTYAISKMIRWGKLVVIVRTDSDD